MQGRIKALYSLGYGFITSNDGVDYFFHYTEIPKKWKTFVQDWILSGRNLIVEFDEDLTATQGPRAKNVRINQQVSD